MPDQVCESAFWFLGVTHIPHLRGTVERDKESEP
jgi:hypothetical protein